MLAQLHTAVGLVIGDDEAAGAGTAAGVGPVQTATAEAAARDGRPETGGVDLGVAVARDAFEVSASLKGKPTAGGGGGSGHGEPTVREKRPRAGSAVEEDPRDRRKENKEKKKKRAKKGDEFYDLFSSLL